LSNWRDVRADIDLPLRTAARSERVYWFGVNETALVERSRNGSWRARRSCGRLVLVLGAASSPRFPGGFERVIARGPDRGAAASQEVGRRDVAERAVQAGGVVVLDEASDEVRSSSNRLVHRAPRGRHR
jgi:hypothetical protein